MLEIDGPVFGNDKEALIRIAQDADDKKKLESCLEEMISEYSGIEEVSTHTTIARLLLFIACLISLGFIGFSLFFCNLMSRRKALLKGLAAFDPADADAIHDFLKPILHRRVRIGESERSSGKRSLLKWLGPNLHTMSWLKKTLDKEIKESRERIRHERLVARLEDHL
jgi:predicted house-cleaning noncanonical NTP pyrophosphatase (MazG superfamily)